MLTASSTQGSKVCRGQDRGAGALSRALEMKLCTERHQARKAVEREERAAKPGNPSPERLRQDDSCLAIYSQLKSKVNQPRLLHASCGGTQSQGAEQRTHPSILPGSQLLTLMLVRRN